LQIFITGKHLKVVPRLRSHLETHLEKLSHYDPRLISAHVVLKTEKYMNVAEITVKAGHWEFYGEGAADDNMFSAIDLAIHRVETQLKKHREKIKGFKKKASRIASRLDRSFNLEIPTVVRSEAWSLKPLTEEAASQDLDLSSKDFLIFKNTRTGKLNVIYRRPDGHHGLVEPEA
jgi:putative sigma-54 modulation protein